MELDEVQDNHTAMGLDSLRSTRPIRSKASTPARDRRAVRSDRLRERGRGAAHDRGVGRRGGRSGKASTPTSSGSSTATRAPRTSGARWRRSPASRSIASWRRSSISPACRSSPIDSVRCTGGARDRCCRRSAISAIRPQSGAGRRRQLVADPGLPADVRRRDHAASVLREKRQERVVRRLPGLGDGECRRPRLLPRRVSARHGADDGGRRSSKLSPAERMAVLSDEWALVRAGRHDVGDVPGSGIRVSRRAHRGRRDDAAGACSTHRRGVHDRRDARPHTARGWRSCSRPALARRRPGRPARRTTDETKALRATWSGSLGGTARDPRGAGEGARRWCCQELDKAGSVEPTLLDVAGHSRRGRGRRRALRPVPRAQQGGDRSRGALSLSLRADVVRRIPRSCGGRWT